MGEESITRVLVVEDNRFSWEFLKAALQGFGIVSEVAADGLDAIHKLDKKRYELVFMDCQMPNMDGYEATRKIRSLLGSNHLIPIVGISATVTTELQERCIRSGMNVLLQKPVTVESLKQLIDKYMPNHKRVKENQNAYDLDMKINFNDAVSLLCKELKISMADASSLLQDFFRIGRQLCFNIEQASVRENQADLTKYAHQIKGMASIMRLREIQAIAERLEKDTGQMTEDISQLKKLLFEHGF